MRMTLEDWFLVGVGVLATGYGIFAVLSPERAFRAGYRWDDRWVRLFTLGRVRSAPGPLMSDRTARKATSAAGIFLCVAGPALAIGVVVVRYPAFWNYVGLIVGLVVAAHGAYSTFWSDAAADRLVERHRWIQWAESIPIVGWWVKGWSDRGSARKRIVFFGVWSMSIGVLIAWASVSRLR
jgi:hypothetical protein